MREENKLKIIQIKHRDSLTEALCFVIFYRFARRERYVMNVIASLIIQKARTLLHRKLLCNIKSTSLNFKISYLSLSSLNPQYLWCNSITKDIGRYASFSCTCIIRPSNYLISSIKFKITLYGINLTITNTFYNTNMR